MGEVDTSYIKYLVGLSKSGRKNSFMELCKLNVDAIYTLVLRTIADLKLSEEVTIDVFIAAWENLNHYREDVAFSDWLKGITVFTIMEEVRTNERRKKLQKQTKLSKNAKIPEAISLNKLERMVFELEEMQRLVFVLHDMEGYSYPEITDFLGERSEKKVKEILKVTRRELMVRI
ncbi:MAG: hypothetical protein A2V66_04155 [Ignavibacteria bacterium RBG_13_36_8]|nr:MAG: hypothetical protein A2V66_04155 [Ignavibacteria bacterium RBG_13_36_8]